MGDMTRTGMACAEFEALMAEALDEALAPARRQAFDAHAAACGDCGPMYAEVAAGQKWLRMLPEVEPPRHLVHNIMVATTGAESAAAAAERKSWLDRIAAWAGPWTKPVFTAVWQPRFAMSAAMAFFSMSLLLTATGTSVEDIVSMDLSPTSVRERVSERYNATAAAIVRYYDNMRLVYQIESLARQMREATTEPAPPPARQPQPKPQPKSAPTAGDEKDSEEQNRYSRENAETILAWRDPEAAPLRPADFDRSDS